jgi:hypothetical protein
MAFQDKKIRLRVFNLSAFGDDYFRYTVCIAGRLLQSKRTLPHRQSMSDAGAKGMSIAPIVLGQWAKKRFKVQVISGQYNNTFYNKLRDKTPITTRRVQNTSCNTWHTSTYSYRQRSTTSMLVVIVQRRDTGVKSPRSGIPSESSSSRFATV